MSELYPSTSGTRGTVPAGSRSSLGTRLHSRRSKRITVTEIPPETVNRVSPRNPATPQRKSAPKREIPIIETKMHGRLKAALINFDFELLPQRQPTVQLMEESISRYLELAKQYRKRPGQKALAMILAAQPQIIDVLKSQTKSGDSDGSIIIYRLDKSEKEVFLYVALVAKTPTPPAAESSTTQPVDTAASTVVDKYFYALYETGSF